MPKYICNWDVGHDGRNYAPGAEISVTGPMAELLLASGAIAKAGKTPGEGDSVPSAGDADQV